MRERPPRLPTSPIRSLVILDEPTLIIDCDFKCPALHNMMSQSWEPGIAEYFHADEPLESCLHPIEGVPTLVYTGGKS